MGRVLVVEDNALVTDAMRVLIEAAGYEVDTATSVEEAVARCRDWRPALMLLDLTLPDGNGLDALRRASAEGCAPAVTVALTGHDEPAVVQRCREAGCREVLLKPVPARELMARVAEWMADASSPSSP